MSSKLIKGAQIKDAHAYFLDIRDLSVELDNIYRSDEGLLQNASWNQREIEELINLKASEKAEEIVRESRQAGYEKGYGEGLKKAEQEAAYLRAEAKDVLEQAKNIHREQLASFSDPSIFCCWLLPLAETNSKLRLAENFFLICL